MEGEKGYCKEAYLNVNTGSCSGMKVVDDVLRRCERVNECPLTKLRNTVDKNKIKK